MSTFVFETDPDTGRLFEIVAWCLKEYFGHSDESASALISRYYAMFQQVHDNDFYHHEGPYWIALRIHYVLDLAGNGEQFDKWRVEHRFTATPPDALQYFRDHYYQR